MINKKRFLILLICIFFTFAVAFYFFVAKFGEFYSRYHGNQSQLRHGIDLFRKNQLNLADKSFRSINSKILSTKDLKYLQFYQAEILFFKGQLKQALKIYLSLFFEYPSFWQSQFRAALCFIFGSSNTISPALSIVQSIHSRDPEVLYWKGRVAQKQSHINIALEYYHAISNPIHDVLLREGNIYFFQKKWNFAKDYFIKSLTYEYLDHQNVIKARVKLLQMYLQEGDFLSAKNEIHHLNALGFNSFTLEQYKAFLLYQEGKIKESYNLLLQLKNQISIFPSFQSLVFKIALQLRDCENLKGWDVSLLEEENDIKSFLFCIKKDENDQNIEQILSKMLSQTKSLPSLQLVLFQELVDIKLQQSDWEGALNYGLIAHSRMSSIDTLFLISKIHKSANNIDGYLHTLEKIALKDETFVKIYFDAILKYKDYDHLELAVSKLLKDNHYHPFGLLYKAKFLYAKYRLNEAKVTLFSLIYSKPNNFDVLQEAYFMLSNLLMEIDEFTSAEILLEEANRKSKISSQNLINLGKIYKKMGKKDQLQSIIKQIQLQEHLSNKDLMSYLSKNHIA